MPVQLFRSTDTGAPTISNTAGSRITALDAILVNGYNSVSVTSMTRSGSTVTVTVSGGHGFDSALAHAVAEIAGAVETAYNGRWKITPTSSTVYTFDIGAATPTSPATGSITSKRAGLGWTKPYSGTNLASYLSPDGEYLAVDDTQATSCRLRGYETMSAVSTGTGPFPTVAQVTNGNTWSVTVASVAWEFVSNGSLFHWWGAMDSSSTGVNGVLLSFGKLGKRTKTGDVYPFIISGATTGGAVDVNCAFLDLMTTARTGCYVARTHTGSGTSLNVGRTVLRGINSNYMGAAGYPYPHATNSAVGYEEIPIHEPNAVIRGTLVGLYAPLHARPLSHKDTFYGTSTDSARRFLALNVYSAGQIFLEISDTWDS